ncbi:MAG: hypothetical protein AAF843_06225, partial [Bacteroidota bacterium]
LCSDPKTGLSHTGFYSKSNQTHRSEIRFGVIGTDVQIEKTLSWIDNFKNRIEASIEYIKDPSDGIEIVDGEVRDYEEDLEDIIPETELMQLFKDEILRFRTDETTESYLLEKTHNPDFPGFTKEQLDCCFVNNENYNRKILERKFQNIIDDKDLKSFDKAIKVGDLIVEQYEALVNEDNIYKPDICIIVLSPPIAKKLASIKLGGGQYFNLRRYLKAKFLSIKNAIPSQIILEETIEGKRKSMQDDSFQAWNFCIANYYKNSCVPWSISIEEKNSCFVGISFNKVLDTEENLKRASVAQAFNHEGDGIIFMGKQFEWDHKEMNTRAPHLTHDYAKSLIGKVLKEYNKHNRYPPNRVVVHKTTDFWDSAISPDYPEVEGLRDGIVQELGDEVVIDFVTVKSSNVKLLRKLGKYPVHRGTLMKIHDKQGILYTTGYIPYYESYPGLHVPHPIEISIYSGDSSVEKVSREIMALTKLNFNNCNFYSSLPITIQFSKRVGEIIQYLEDGIVPPSKYYYYM